MSPVAHREVHREIALLGRIGWRNKRFLFALPIASFVVTVIHESAHAVAAWAQGAKIQEFRVWPHFRAGVFHLGYVRHDGNVASDWLVAFAPTIVWAIVVLATVDNLHKVRSRTGAKIAWIVLVAGPMRDVSMTSAGLFLRDTSSDYYRALGDAGGPMIVPLVVFFVGFGWRLHRALERRFGVTFRPTTFAVGYALFLGEAWIPQWY